MKDLYRLIEIIRKVQGLLTEDSNMDWTHYETAQELQMEMEERIAKLQDEDQDSLTYFHVLFLPTAAFQELAMSNGWHEKYMELAEEFDFLYSRLVTTTKWKN